jgi:hypothetical protein
MAAPVLHLYLGNWRRQAGVNAAEGLGSLTKSTGIGEGGGWGWEAIRFFRITNPETRIPDNEYHEYKFPDICSLLPIFRYTRAIKSVKDPF